MCLFLGVDRVTVCQSVDKDRVPDEPARSIQSSSRLSDHSWIFVYPFQILQYTAPAQGARDAHRALRI